MWQPTKGGSGRAQAETRRLRPRVEGLEGRALMTAGALDTTFGGTGTVVTSVGSDYGQNANNVTGMAIQSDGKIVEVGGQTVQINRTLHMSLVVVRLNTDGSLDTSFGNRGQVSLAVNADNWSGWYDHMFSVAIQSDGKIVVAGDTKVTYGKGSHAVTRADLLVARLNSNGSLDTTFNGTGKATLDFPQGDVYACGVALQPNPQDPNNPKIVVAGSHENAGPPMSPGTGPGFVVARWTSDGRLDTSFGPNGQGYNTRPSGGCNAMALDSSGNVLVGGTDGTQDPATGTYPSALVRYTANGLIDSSFGTNGEVLLANLGRGVTGIGFQSSGQIVVCGAFGYDATNNLRYIARLQAANGALDTIFGSGGYYSNPNTGRAEGLVVQPDDAILVTEMPVQNGTVIYNAFAVDRVLSDGQSLDSGFGTGGRALATFAPTTYADIPYAIALDPNGNITVGGVVYDSSNHRNFGTARFLS